MLIDNRRLLRAISIDLVSRLEQLPFSDSVKVVKAKNGQNTLQINREGKKLYIHSVYNPDKETDILIEKLHGDLQPKQPILFIGLGCGYHIKKIVNEFSPSWFSIAEFNPYILKNALELVKLTTADFSNLKNIHLVEKENDFLESIGKDLNDTNVIPQIVVLPGYERIYKKEVQAYFNSLNLFLKARKRDYVTTASYQKRWTYNSFKNFPQLLNTPNLLVDLDKTNFSNKPAILVSAGPSLNEEIENLRKIKEDGSAFIFSVGSAVNALIENDIYPHAAFTYDPTVKNQFVFEKIKEKGIRDIPLFFGSSVGFETLENYPGDMFHFITSQDFLSAYILNQNENKIDIALDAPSIAIVALQILAKLDFHPIILAGQNFAYKSNTKYASGIEYDFVENDLKDKEKEEAVEVESVDGKKVLTSEGFLQMKQSMELVLSRIQNKTVYNTTQSGAKIEGTVFKRLDHFAGSLPKDTVQHNWLEKRTSSYDCNEILKIWRKVSEENQYVYDALQEINKVIIKIEKAVNLRKVNKLEHLFSSLDKQAERINNFLFFKIFIRSMSRFEYDIVSKELRQLRYQKNILAKGEEVAKNYRRLHSEWMLSYGMINNDIDKVYKDVQEVCIEM